MTISAVLFVLLSLILPQKIVIQKAQPGAVSMPDYHRTPGLAMNNNLAQICDPGYAKSVRAVSEALKKRVYEEYGIQPHMPDCCEIDHLISLELGGSNDIRNLWPQPYLPAPGAYEKDQLEDKLHELVCKNQLDLKSAQDAIAHDWYGAYMLYVKGVVSGR